MPHNPSGGIEHFEITGGSYSGNAGTATALASAPTICNSGQAARGVLASGNATGCQTVGAGSYGTVVDAQTGYGLVSGGQVFDASYNTTTTISFPNADCPTYAQVGWIDFGTTLPNTFAGNGTLLVPQGTIVSGCSGGLASGTITVSGAATGNCTPSGGTMCNFVFGPDATTPLTNFWNAVLSTPNCPSGVLPSGVFLVQKGVFNGTPSATGYCFYGANVTENSVSLHGVAEWPGTWIVPTPNFDTTVGTGNSCGGGHTTHACFLGSSSIVAEGLTIWGAGQPRASDTNHFNIIELNGDTGTAAENNALLQNAVVEGWAAQAVNAVGVYVDDVSAAWLLNVFVNTAGGTACEFAITFPTYVDMWGGACANGQGQQANPPESLYLPGSGVFNSQGVCICSISSGTHVAGVRVDNGGIWNSLGDFIDLIPTAGTGDIVVNVGSTIHMNGSFINDIDATNTINHGILTATSGITTLQNTNIDMTRSGAMAFSIGASTTIQDQCGNTVLQGASSTITGSLVNCAMEPSIGGLCNSSASPAICGLSSRGAITVAAAATTVVVNTTAVGANSVISVQFDSSLGTRLGVTCNTTADLPAVTARTAGVSFTITVPSAPVTNPACYSYTVIG